MGSMKFKEDPFDFHLNNYNIEKCWSYATLVHYKRLHRMGARSDCFKPLGQVAAYWLTWFSVPVEDGRKETWCVECKSQANGKKNKPAGTDWSLSMLRNEDPVGLQMLWDFCSYQPWTVWPIGRAHGSCTLATSDGGMSSPHPCFKTSLGRKVCKFRRVCILIKLEKFWAEGFIIMCIWSLQFKTYYLQMFCW